MAGIIIAHALDLASAGTEYLDNSRLEKELKSLATDRGDLIRLKQVAETIKGNSVWLAEIGTGIEEERKRRPALLLVAGIEGGDLAGTSSALFWVRQLADGYTTKDRIRKLLDSTTIYVFPRLNPDAADTLFSLPKRESIVNARPVDDDHDGLIDEDGPEDLNGDGLITWMRIEDPEGDYVMDPAESRLLMKADKSKGEQGQWRYLLEGKDNDHDEAWNEDGTGGVNLNRNFPYNYRFFAGGTGLHPVSELETRALADFVVDHPNVGIIFTFGGVDNLVQTPKGEPGGKRPPTTIQEGDLPFYRELGKAYREALGLKKELQGNSEPGTFSDWMYFHRGRLSLAARPWSQALQVELAKTNAASSKPQATHKDDKRAGDAQPESKPNAEKAGDASEEDKKSDAKAKPATETRNQEERAFLKWIDENAPSAFLPWKRFEHPDFPGRKVEIGGFAPSATTSPPEKLLDEFASKHAKFLTELAEKLPRVGIRKAEAKHLGASIYQLVVQVENRGYLPTALAQGVTTREVLPTRVVFEANPDDILAGAKTSSLGVIDGSGGMKEVRCTLRAKGTNKLGVEVISALGGSVKTTIDLQVGE